MDIPAYAALHVSISDGVADIVLDNPPVNTLSAQLMTELHDLLARLREDRSVRVLVFSSLNADFFLAHVDMGIFEHMDELQRIAAERPGVNVFQSMGELLRTQPQVSIVKLAGIARAGGAEFVAAADMAFAARETAKIAQSESLMGIVPGGGGTQYLLERVGRNRALELVLSAELLDADTASRYGWINRAVAADELDSFVDTLARNIAALGPDVIAGAKRTLPPAHLSDGYRVEDDAWAGLVGTQRVADLMGEAVRRDMQTREQELDLEHFFRTIAAGLDKMD